MSLIIHKIINNPIHSNCYIIYNKEENCDCIIIDPGSEDITSYTEFITKNRLNPKYIILTHQHFDHCFGVNGLRIEYPNVKLICSKFCNIEIQNSKKNCSVFYDNEKAFIVKPANIVYDDIGLLEWNNYKINIYPTPGHTSGSISIIIENNIFMGDAWIKNTKTVTKLPTGNIKQQNQTDVFLHSLHGITARPGHGECFIIE